MNECLGSKWDIGGPPMYNMWLFIVQQEPSTSGLPRENVLDVGAFALPLSEYKNPFYCQTIKKVCVDLPSQNLRIHVLIRITLPCLFLFLLYTRFVLIYLYFLSRLCPFIISRMFSDFVSKRSGKDTLWPALQILDQNFQWSLCGTLHLYY